MATVINLPIEEVRAQFPILSQKDSKGRTVAFLDNGASTQKPLSVIEKETEVYSRYYANAYRGVYEYGERINDELEQTRAAVQQFIGCESSNEIVFTSGTTMSLNVIAQGLGGVLLQPGDEILISLMEHHANIVPWQMIAARTGAQLKYLPLTEDGRLDLSELDTLLTKRTRIVSLTGMSNVLGTLPELKALSKAAHDVGAVFVVDAAQSIAHGPTDVIDADIDFLAFSGHKIYGPTGIGVLYGKMEWLERMDPLLGGGHMIDQVSLEGSTWAPPPAKFEAGTIPIAQAIALRSSLEFLQQYSWQDIHSHEQDLLEYATDRLSTIDGLTIWGPSVENKGSIISMTVEGAHPQDLAFLLNRHGVCVRHGHHCTMLLHDHLGISASVRASFGIYNTRSEADMLYEGIVAARKRLRLA